MFSSKHAKAVKDAKAFAALMEQFDLPYVVELNNVVIAGTPQGQQLLTLWHEESNKNEPIIWYDESGYDHRYVTLCRNVKHGFFDGYVWLFQDITENQKNYEDFENRSLHMDAEIRTYKEVLNNFSFPVWMQGVSGQILYTNQKYEELFSNGIPQAVRDIIKDAMKGSEFYVRNTPAIVLGERRQLEVKVQPLAHGRTLAWTADRTDVLEEVAARNRLLDAQRTLFEHLHTGIAMYDETQSLTFYNSAFARVWDLDDAYLNTHPKLGDVLEHLRVSRYLPEQSDFKAFKNDILSRFTGLLAPLEEMLYLPDGRTLRLLSVPNPAGGLMVTFEDVTSTLQLESSVNTLLAVQRETLDNMTEAMAVYGGDGRLKLWNPQYAQLWGFYPEDLGNEPHISTLTDVMVKRFPADQQSDKHQMMTAHALARQDHAGRFVFADGRQINLSAVPLPDGATLLAYDDVTDAYKVEQALRDRAQALEAAEQLKLDFLANVSYQLRVPLNSITGFAELLEHQYFGQLNTKQMEYAKGITEAGQYLLALVDAILDLSTIEAGYMELHRDVIDVRAMVAGIYHLTEEWARKAQHTYTLSMDEDLGSLEGDERRLKQAILNLIRNAISYTPRGGRIEIGAYRKDAHVEITVTDNGVGIAPEHQARVFESFERVDNIDMNTHSGAGLGLSLVRSIIDLHGGRVELVSTPGVGTTITLILPVSS